MSKDINHVIATGHVVRDSELTETQYGTKILKFSIACNERRKKPQTEEWEDVPSFFDCTFFGNAGSWMKDEIHKGRFVIVDGHLKQSTWEKDGQRRSKVEIIVETVRFDQARRTEQKRGVMQGLNQAPYGQAFEDVPTTIYEQALPDEDLPTESLPF